MHDRCSIAIFHVQCGTKTCAWLLTVGIHEALTYIIAVIYMRIKLFLLQALSNKKSVRRV